MHVCCGKHIYDRGWGNLEQDHISVFYQSQAEKDEAYYFNNTCHLDLDQYLEMPYPTVKVLIESIQIFKVDFLK